MVYPEEHNETEKSEVEVRQYNNFLEKTVCPSLVHANQLEFESIEKPNPVNENLSLRILLSYS